jgi:hypothetical protein
LGRLRTPDSSLVNREGRLQESLVTPASWKLGQEIQPRIRLDLSIHRVAVRIEDKSEHEARRGRKDRRMPLYLLSVCYPSGGQPPSSEKLAQITTDVTAVTEAMNKAGAWVFGGGLHDPSSATTVFEQDGNAVLTDGPFIESKEQIGGITIIEVADLDEALDWATQVSRATTTPIEVRPFTYRVGPTEEH